MYRVGTIGGLADQFPALPIDPSWLPPNTVYVPGSGLAPAPAPSRPASSASLVPWVVVGVAGLALGVVLLRR